jgi:hypothetical protein
MKESTQVEINQWELEYLSRIVKWIKDFENQTITFVLDDEKRGETITFKIKQ